MSECGAATGRSRRPGCHRRWPPRSATALVTRPSISPATSTPTPPPERVAAGEGESLGVAVEHALSACQVLAEGLDDASLDAFRVALPREFAGLFACYRRPQAVQRSGGTLASGRSLASGRPGTARPLSEAHRVEAFE